MTIDIGSQARIALFEVPPHYPREEDVMKSKAIAIGCALVIVLIAVCIGAATMNGAHDSDDSGSDTPESPAIPDYTPDSKHWSCISPRLERPNATRRRSAIV